MSHLRIWVLFYVGLFAGLTLFAGVFWMVSWWYPRTAGLLLIASGAWWFSAAVKWAKYQHTLTDVLRQTDLFD